MPRYVILAQSEITANALGAWLEQLGEKPVASDCHQRIVWQKNSIGKEESGVLSYENLARRIEDAARDSSNVIPLNEVIVLVDSVTPDELKPLQHGGDWDHLLAMLILTYPEIHWVFGFISPTPDKLLVDHHSLPSLIMNPRRDPLFDATGLRNKIRYYAEANEKGKSILPTRLMKAAAIDEESSYSLFHAYTAYRFGYLADAVRSWALMKFLFCCGSKNEKGTWNECEYPNKYPQCRTHGYDLLFEDINLNFADKGENQHFSDLENERAKECTLLRSPLRENSRFRVLISSGHSGLDSHKMRKNQDYLEKHNPTGCAFVLKPVGGMFNLWIKAQLFKRLDPLRGKEWAGNHIGQAPGFIWPPTEIKDGSHSAPGKLMLIAQNLVRRADSLKDCANTVEECIRGAVLATDALELLRFQTPTLALQALCLKHEFEVKAEVAFLGVGHHFEVIMRLDELERDVKAASSYFEEKRRRASELDTLVSIGNRLVMIFRNAGQFDEEMLCMARVRKWHRQLRLKQSTDPIDYVSQLFMTYAEWLLVSPRRFVGAILFWFIVFWGMWWGIAPEGIKNGNYGAASSAWNSFVAANPSTAEDFSGNVLNAAASAFGLFHLGVFISYLYSTVSRK